MADAKEFTSRHTATARQVTDDSEVVVTSTGRQTAYKGDWVVTEQRLGFTYDYIMAPDDFHGDWQEKDSGTSVEDALKADEHATNPEDAGSTNEAPPVTQASPSAPAIAADTVTNPATAQNAGAVEGATPQEVGPAPSAPGSAASETTGTDPANDLPPEVTAGPTQAESTGAVAPSPDAQSTEAAVTDPSPAVSTQTDEAASNPDSPTSANVANVAPPVGDNAESASVDSVNADAATVAAVDPAAQEGNVTPADAAATDAANADTSSDNTDNAGTDPSPAKPGGKRRQLMQDPAAPDATGQPTDAASGTDTPAE